MVQGPNEVKPPYPWKPLPDMYRRLSILARGQPGETAFWLEHARTLAVPYSRLVDTVSKDPDNPDAPTLLTVTSENQRGRDFDTTIRLIADVLKPRPGEIGTIHPLMQTLFLILSGDTKEATAILDRLPPIDETDSTRIERVARVLARSLLAYGVKKGDKPIGWTRRGLALLSDQVKSGDSLSEWEWALIMVYAAVPSFFHEEYAGKKGVGPDVMDLGLTLIGRGEEGHPLPPRGLNQAIVAEVRRQIRDAAKRGTDQLGSLDGDGAQRTDLILGCQAARWQILASDPGEEGKLWYGLYMGWLTSAGRALSASTDPQVKVALDSLEKTLERRRKTERSGVMTACKARIAQVRQDLVQATALLSQAKATVVACGLKEKDEAIWEALDRQTVELRLPQTPPKAR